jgi:hypothetical protein
MNGYFDPVAADIAFHATILEISHNRFYHQLTPIVETALRFSIRLTNKTKGALADYDAHDKVYRAIRNSNPDAAARACRELITEALALVTKSTNRAERFGLAGRRTTRLVCGCSEQPDQRAGAHLARQQRGSPGLVRRLGRRALLDFTFRF